MRITSRDTLGCIGTLMEVASTTRNTNWWGLVSTIGLFVWFSYWFKNEPHGVTEHALLWGPMALIHWFGIQAARRPFGWLYLVPLGVFWILVIIAIFGGIPASYIPLPVNSCNQAMQQLPGRASGPRKRSQSVVGEIAILRQLRP